MSRPLVLTLLAFLLTGCGYSSSSLMPTGIRTVALPMFDNDTFRRGFEVQLTEALAKEIMTRTDLRIAEAPLADSIIEGTITDFRQPVATEDAFDNVSEIRIFLSVKLTWKDQRTGEVIYEAEGLTTSDEFVVPLGQNLDTALARAFDKMAELIVSEMETRNW